MDMRLHHWPEYAVTEGLIKISNILKSSDESEFDRLRGLLRIGLQWNTEVTISSSAHSVSQAYCSALPIGYSPCSTELWSEFSRIILEASYEAAICAGILNFYNTGNNKIFLTLVGGGVFGNNINLIIGAIQRVLDIYKHVNIDVIVVSFGSLNPFIQKLTEKY